jgi:hypothetical protein
VRFDTGLLRPSAPLSIAVAEHALDACKIFGQAVRCGAVCSAAVLGVSPARRGRRSRTCNGSSRRGYADSSGRPAQVRALAMFPDDEPDFLVNLA